ncbi:hypothetical protein [Streptomyces sp. NPDC003697]
MNTRTTLTALCAAATLAGLAACTSSKDTSSKTDKPAAKTPHYKIVKQDTSGNQRQMIVEVDSTKDLRPRGGEPRGGARGARNRWGRAGRGRGAGLQEHGAPGRRYLPGAQEVGADALAEAFAASGQRLLVERREHGCPARSTCQLPSRVMCRPMVVQTGSAASWGTAGEAVEVLDGLNGDVAVGVRGLQVPAQQIGVEVLALEVGGEGADQEVVVSEGVGQGVQD